MLVDIQAIRDLIDVAGQPIEFCSTVDVPADSSIGRPAKREVKKKIVKGYLSPNQVSRLLLAAGNNVKAEFTAYFTCRDLTDTDLTGAKFLLFENNYYQVEGMDTIYHEGVKIIYKYRLSKVPPNQGNFLNKS